MWWTPSARWPTAAAAPWRRWPLSWVTDRPGVSSTILGARTLEQLEGNLGAAGLHLSAEETARLDAASDPGAADYPYGGPAIEQRSRRLEGS